MTVISTVASRTMAESRSPDDFIEIFEERLAALARVQDLLTRSDGEAPVTFKELVDAELRAMGVETGDRVYVSGPADVPLPAAPAQALALVLHELATNSLKYGALRHGGRLSLDWNVQGIGPRRRLRLEWQEQCPVSTNASSARTGGYGRKLIEHALPFQFGAKTGYEFKPDGVHCTIDLPLSTDPGARSST